MKWTTKPPRLKKREPERGERRERIVFSFLPRRCRDGTTRWLERVLIAEEWTYIGILGYGWTEDPRAEALR